MNLIAILLNATLFVDKQRHLYFISILVPVKHSGKTLLKCTRTHQIELSITMRYCRLGNNCRLLLCIMRQLEDDSQRSRVAGWPKG